MVFSALGCVLRAAYHARQNFFWPELSQLTESIVGLGALIWALPTFGIYAAAAIYVFRAMILTLLLLPGLGKYSYLDWRSPALGKAWERMKPLVLATLYYKSGPLVDRFLTSMTPSGGLSLFYFSQQLYEAANHLIGRAVAGPVLPLLAVHRKSGKLKLFKRTYRARLLVVLGVGTATVLLVLVLVEPILRIRQDLDDEGVRAFWWITAGLAGFFIGGAMGQVISSAFYAQGDVQTPTRVGMVGFTLGIGLKVIGFLLSGLLGVAVATSCYYMGNALAMYLLLERKDDALSG
jgi:peptidoglycan biosynthesis protein MviN/MurJ (putative lipid II flippase)